MSSLSTSSQRPDDESDSSSVVYDHEPFDTFRHRVLALALSIWRDGKPDEFTIERLPGGGFNRIIGLTRRRINVQSNTSANANTQYILRIPRFDAAQVDREVTVLQFLSQHTSIPAPKVIEFDETSDNVLNSPYTVQNRIAGVDLYSSFPNLSHKERCLVARELGGIFNQMLAVRSSMAGKLVLPGDHKKSEKTPIHVAPLGLTDPSLARPYGDDSAPPQSAYELLTSVFLARKADDLERCPSDTVGPELWDRFCRMTSELDAGGWLVDRQYSIAHLDLAPRNILVNASADAQQQLPIISGVLDWDSAVLAPMFMSCSPPLWIWAWQDDEDEDERTANDTPPTPEGQQLKMLFERAAGQDYMRLAYEPAYRLARRLVQFAIEGVRSNEDFKEAEAMLQEFSLIKKGKGP